MCSVCKDFGIDCDGGGHVGKRIVVVIRHVVVVTRRLGYGAFAVDSAIGNSTQLVQSTVLFRAVTVGIQTRKERFGVMGSRWVRGSTIGGMVTQER